MGNRISRLEDGDGSDYGNLLLPLVYSEMSDHVKTTIETYNRIADDYRLTAIPEIRAWEEDSMRIFGRMLSGKSVLIPGCGDGRDSRFLSTLGHTVTSFDLSEAMLSRFRNKIMGKSYAKNADLI